MIDKIKEIPSGFFEGAILCEGKWITWQFYRDLHGIEDFGYIGDAVNGTVEPLNKYPEYFTKELSKYHKLNLISLLQSDIERLEKAFTEDKRDMTHIIDSEISLKRQAIEELKK